MSVVALKQPLPDLPTQKLERWKYTPFARAISKLNLTSAASKIEFTPNQYVTLSKTLPDWAMRSIKPEKDEGDLALWTINNANFQDVLVIDVPAGIVVDEAIALNLVAPSGTQLVYRIAIRIGAGAQATIVEQHQAQGQSFKNIVTQIVLDKNANLTHLRLQNDLSECVHAQTTHITQARDSNYKVLTLTTGAALSRNQIFADLMCENASCVLAGSNMLKGTQHGDTTILVEHQAPHCMSNQNYKTVLDGSAHGVFQGKVHVHQIAQKTDGYQLSNAILLSPLAHMDTKPELEIYADDVKCSHGATTGQLDDEPLFYLRSRGLSESQARALLLKSVLMQPVLTLQNETLQAQAETLIDQWLESLA